MNDELKTMIEALEAQLATITGEVARLRSELDKAETQHELFSVAVKALRQMREPDSKNIELPRPPGRFADATVKKAATILIREAGHRLSTDELTKRMIEGGLTFRAKRPAASVFGILREAEKDEASPIVKVGAGLWSTSDVEGLVNDDEKKGGRPS